MAGLTEDGLIVETFQSIIEQIKARLRTEFGDGLPLDESTIEGTSWAILADALTKVWEVLEVFFSSLDPDKATKAALDALCLLTGTIRKTPSFGVGNVFLIGDVGTVALIGIQVRLGGDGSVASTYEESSAFVAADAYVPTADQEIGDIRESGGHLYYALTAGTNGGVVPVHTSRPISMASPAIVSPEGDITDGDIVWIWLGEGPAYATVPAVALELGPVSYPAFAITDIVTPQVGITSVANALDFELGRDLESDESLRESRVANLAAPGTGTPDAIRAALLDLNDVVSVTVFVNRTMVTDADGVPPKSIEVLVRGGDDQEIRDCLLANVCAGIETFGNTSGTARDSEGTEQPINFSRPDEIEVYVAMTLTKDPDVYPSDGDDQVALGVVNFGDAQDTGKDAIAQSIGATANALEIGVIEVTEVLISDAPGPTLSTTIAITKRQLAVFDTSRTSVTSSDVEP